MILFFAVDVLDGIMVLGRNTKATLKVLRLLQILLCCLGGDDVFSGISAEMSDLQSVAAACSSPQIVPSYQVIF